MYFTYLLLLRAVVKGAPLWTPSSLHSGNIAQDEMVIKIIQQLIKNAG